MPRRPSAASDGITSEGKCCAASHSLTCGRSSVSANSRTPLPSSRCSSVNRKSMPRTIMASGGFMTRVRTAILGLGLALGIVGAPGVARADITVFIGATTTPENRMARGFSVGLGLLIVAFEFEYANTPEDVEAGAPSLRTGSGNVLLQTPIPVFGVQPYFTTGGGFYREELGALRADGLRAQRRRRRQDLAGGSVATAGGLPDLQAGGRCLVFTDASHLRGAESALLPNCRIADLQDCRRGCLPAILQGCHPAMMALLSEV